MICSKVSSPATARKFIEERDELVRNGSPVHRVTSLLVGSVIGNYRHDFEIFVQEGILSKRLCRILTGYRCCWIDDTLGERTHSLTSVEAKRARGSRLGFIGANVRFNETIKTVGPDEEPDNEFTKYFTFWKSILQQDQSKSDMYIRKRIPDNVAIKQIYLTGKAALQLGAGLPTDPKVRRSFTSTGRHALSVAVKAKEEFIKLSIFEGGIFSFNVPNNGSAGESIFFEVIDTRARFKKVHGNRQHEEKKNYSNFICTIQMYLVSTEDSDNELSENQKLIFPSGSPETLKIEQQYPWDKWRRELTQWTLMESTSVGCAIATNPKSACTWPRTSVFN